MKKQFINDYPGIHLSKYLLNFIDKMCDKLNFHLYYNPQSQRFIISDEVLNEDYRYYKNSHQIKSEPNSTLSSYKFNWKKKTILLFNHETPYEQDDGDWYYPEHYDSNHTIEYKMSNPNMQRLLLCVFKNPILQENHRTIQEIIPTYNIDIYFPSEFLKIDPSLDFLLIKNLEQNNLLESILKSNKKDIIKILQKKPEDYLVNFFNCLKEKKNLKIKDLIFEITNNPVTLEKIFENLPEFKKFLQINKPTNFLNKDTEEITIFKSFFNPESLSIIYHNKFNTDQTRDCLLNILNDYSLKECLNKKNIFIHSSFYDYSNKSVTSIIENKSLLSIQKIEEFFCESLSHITKNTYINVMEDKNNKNNLIKFFNYFYQNELSLQRTTNIDKKLISKI